MSPAQLDALKPYALDASGTPVADGLDWARVTAVHVNMVFRATQGTLTKTDTEGTDSSVITRTLNDYILLRNHQEIQ